MDSPYLGHTHLDCKPIWGYSFSAQQRATKTFLPIPNSPDEVPSRIKLYPFSYDQEGSRVFSYEHGDGDPTYMWKLEEKGASQWMLDRNPTKYIPQAIFRFKYNFKKRKIVPYYAAKMCQTVHSLQLQR